MFTMITQDFMSGRLSQAPSTCATTLGVLLQCIPRVVTRGEVKRAEDGIAMSRDGCERGCG